MEDKKRVLVEAGAEREDSELEMKRVSAAIRMLGSSFFQEYTSGKRDKNLRTYDHMAFGAIEEHEEPSEDASWEYDDPMDDETIEALAAEDDDASLVLQFENAILDTVQDRQGPRHLFRELSGRTSSIAREVQIPWFLAPKAVQRGKERKRKRGQGQIQRFGSTHRQLLMSSLWPAGPLEGRMPDPSKLDQQ